LTLHGRTRIDGYSGDDEYQTIAAVKAAVNIPVVANGDITTPEKARQVLEFTKADAIMVSRAVQGQPWIFGQIDHYLRTEDYLPARLMTEVQHLMSARTTRKHIGLYVHDFSRGHFGNA